VIDLITMVYQGEVSLDEAYRVFDETIAAIHRGEASPEWWTTLGFSQYEAAAYLHEATLADIVKLRYAGWPTSCCRCGLPLDYRLYGWWFVHADDEVPRIRHIECPTISMDEVDTNRR
jgi:hypothetical protein